MRTIKADLQNHFTTKSKVLDPTRVAQTVAKKLGKGGLCGLVNYNDRRYEAFAERAKDMDGVKDYGNGVYFPTQDVLVVKGEEVRTKEGDLLVVGIYEGDHLRPERGLHDSLREAHDLNGIPIITTPYFRSNVGRVIVDNPALLQLCDAIEVHNGEAFPQANQRALDLYNQVRIDHPHLGFIASSDGHTFREVGSSYTELRMPYYEEIQTDVDMISFLRNAIKTNGSLKKSYSPLAAVNHATILVYMIAASKLPRSLQSRWPISSILNRGDDQALR